MKKTLPILSLIACVSLASLFGSVNANAQTATINFIQITPATCEGGGSVEASVSVPGACSVDGFLPGTSCALFGPGQSGEYFTTYHTYGLYVDDLAPGNYYYRVSALSPCLGSAEFPFTIEDEGSYPNLDITLNAIDCSPEDFVTVQNNSTQTVNMAVLNGPELGTIAPGQSVDYPNNSYDFILTAFTESCPTPVEFVGVGPVDPWNQNVLGLIEITADLSTVNSSDGQSNGSATVLISDGIGPYDIVWSNNATFPGEWLTSTIDNLPPGSYSVEITAANDCSWTEEFLITNEEGTNIEDLSTLFDNVKIVPNPARGNNVSLLIDALTPEILSISILNSLGQEVIPVQAYPLTQGSNQLNLDLNSKLSTGLYYVKIIADNKAGTLPLMYVQD